MPISTVPAPAPPRRKPDDQPSFVNLPTTPSQAADVRRLTAQRQALQQTQYLWIVAPEKLDHILLVRLPKRRAMMTLARRAIT